MKSTIQITLFNNFVKITDIDYKDIAKQKRKDEILSKVMDSINIGTVQILKDEQYTPCRLKANELSVERGFVL